jgi:hypothetical protein
MHMNCVVFKSRIVPYIMAMMLAACSSSDSLNSFTTDGCSLFFDRSPFGKADWCHCCVAHDLAYWRGGSEEARLNADKELSACVLKATGSDVLANSMYAGVRMVGTPYMPTSFRWGFGWPFGRGYEPLTPEDEMLASLLEQEYRAKNPRLVCPDRTPPP